MAPGTDDALVAFVRDNHDRYLAELTTWVACPSISADPAHAGDVRASALAAVERMRAAGSRRGLETAGAGRLRRCSVRRVRRPS